MIVVYPVGNKGSHGKGGLIVAAMLLAGFCIPHAAGSSSISLLHDVTMSCHVMSYDVR